MGNDVDYDALGAELLFEANIRDVPPRISVRMITYGHERFIVKAVSSILEGTYSDYELIISDDASPDNTAEVLLNYLRSYNGTGQVRYIRQKKNGGLDGKGGHRLVFQSLIRGSIVMSMDGDDFSCPDRLARTIELWDSLDPEPSLMIVNAYRYIDETGKIDGLAVENCCKQGGRVFYPPGDVFNVTARPFGSGTICSRRFYDWVGRLKPVYRIMAGDALQVRRAMLDKGIWFVNEPLFYYRVNAGSVSHKGIVTWTHDRLLRWRQLKLDMQEIAVDHKLKPKDEKMLDYWIRRTMYAEKLLQCSNARWLLLWVRYCFISPADAIFSLKLHIKKIFLGSPDAVWHKRR